MVWYNPLTWFGRSAQVILKNSNTNVLKSALRNYIKAVSSLKPNGRTNQAITNLLNQANANATNKRVMRNRLANGVAKIVIASKNSLGMAAAATTGAPGAPSETQAAAAVNNATAKIKNLNQRMAELNTLLPPGATATPNNKARLYMAKKYNNAKNRAINTNGKYAAIWKAINTLKTENRLKAALPPRSNVPNTALVLKFLNNHKNDNVNKAARIMAGQFKNTNLSTLALTNLSNKKQEILNKAIQFKRNNNATRAARAAAKLNQEVAGIFSSNLEQAPVAPNLGAFVNKSKAAAELLYKQAYGGIGGIGLKSGQWTVNKSVQNLTNTNNKMARFIGLNRAIVNANLNARSNKGQANRAKKVLNAIIQKQTAVPGN